MFEGVFDLICWRWAWLLNFVLFSIDRLSIYNHRPVFTRHA